MTLMPATVQECFELMVEAFNIAETYRIPVIFAPDEITAHLRETFVEPKPGSLPVRFRPQAFSPAGTVRTIRFRQGRGRSAGLLW